MARGGFDYREFMELYKGTQEIRKQFRTFMEDFLTREALIALRLVKPLTPVDTGTLRRSWSISKVERLGNSLIIWLVNPIEYASYMESGFTYQTKNGEAHFEGFHMAELSLLQVRQKMPAKWDREFRQWLARLNWR